MSAEGDAYRQARTNVAIVTAAGVQGGAAGLHTIGTEFTNTIRLLLTGPSPSAPGEPPGLVYGGLRLSFGYEVSEQGDEATLVMGSDASTRRPVTGEAVDYSGHLEEGAGEIAPRPHVRPTMAIITPLINPMLSRSITTAERVAARGLRGTTVGR